ncbi:hypothetical protein LCGC14_2696160 [marine sediment metagenome]|uniref:Uncharacterized protein n=1 Tax=marine sediment metagenome TaxID=412755 RepID=A0A0F8ZH11_9ZZZZ
MKLDSLTLTRGYTHDKPLTGTATFSTPDEHKLTIKLNEADAVAITELCAVAIARIGRETAEALTADALQFTAIEHQS